MRAPFLGLFVFAAGCHAGGAPVVPVPVARAPESPRAEGPTPSVPEPTPAVAVRVVTVERGTFVRVATLPATVAALPRSPRAVVRVSAPIDGSTMHRDVVGRPAELVVEGLPGLLFRTTVARTERPTEHDGPLLAIAEIEDPSRILRPGMRGTLRIEVQRIEDTLVVPTEAVTPGASDVVYFEEGGRARAHVVECDNTTGEQSQVVDGLVGGERILVPASALSDGVPVRVETESA